MVNMNLQNIHSKKQLGQLCQAPMMYIYIVPLSQGVNISINNFSIVMHDAPRTSQG